MRHTALCLLLLSAACVPEPPGRELLDGHVPLGDGLVVWPKVLWPKPYHVPVCFLPDASGPDSHPLREYVKRGASQWETASQVRFVDWADCISGVPYAGISIRFEDTEGSPVVGWSYFGRQSIGYQPSMMLSSTRLTNDEVAMSATHEFGHALGFWHEQTRMDTPAECIPSDARTQRSDAVTVGTYDPNSVMNYCDPVWANGGVLSATDREGAAEYYGAPTVFGRRQIAIRNAVSQKCVDIQWGSTQAGAPVQQWACNGTPAQTFTILDDGQLQAAVSQMCLTVAGDISADGALIEQRPCASEPSQIWTIGSDERASIVLAASDKCLDDPAGSRESGARLIVWGCHGGANQAWVVTDALAE